MGSTHPTSATSAPARPRWPLGPLAYLLGKGVLSPSPLTQRYLKPYTTGMSTSFFTVESRFRLRKSEASFCREDSIACMIRSKPLRVFSHRTDTAGRRRMGPRHAALHGAGQGLVMLTEGTHTIVMEKNRLKLFEAVQSFLDEASKS